MINPYGTNVEPYYRGPVWLLPTRGRPELCQRFLEACVETGMTSPGVAWVDPTAPGQYDAVKWPENWWVVTGRGDMAPAMAWTFAQFPQASAYGWLGDDTVPITSGWDKALEEAAGEWYVSCCRDSYLVGNSFPNLLTGAFVMGGDLVRAVGWWALPGVLQAGVDDAWGDIVVGLGHLRFLNEICFRHDNYRTSRRPRDETDSWEREGVAYIEKDFENWTRQRNGVGDIQNRVREAMKKAGIA